MRLTAKAILRCLLVPSPTSSLRPMHPDTTLCCARSCSSTLSLSCGLFCESFTCASAECFTSHSCQRPIRTGRPASSGRMTQSGRMGRSDDGHHSPNYDHAFWPRLTSELQTRFTPNCWLWLADYEWASCFHTPAPFTPITTEMSCTRCSDASSG